MNWRSLPIVLLLCGCNSLFHDRDRIDDTHGYPKAEVEGWLNEAERLLCTVTPGMTYDGEGINVYPHAGVKFVRGHWVDAYSRGAYTQGGSERQYVHLFTDPHGREQAVEGVHEMIHCVLLSHGISGIPTIYSHLTLPCVVVQTSTSHRETR